MSMASDFLANVGTSVSGLASALTQLDNKEEASDCTRWTFADGSTIEIKRSPEAQLSYRQQEATSDGKLWA